MTPQESASERKVKQLLAALPDGGSYRALIKRALDAAKGQGHASIVAILKGKQ